MVHGMLDALDVRLVPDEMIIAWQQHEAIALSGGVPRSTTESRVARLAALRIIMMLCERSERCLPVPISDITWFKSVQLFDLSHRSSAEPPREVYIRAMAAWHMSVSLESHENVHALESMLIPQCDVVARSVGTAVSLQHVRDAAMGLMAKIPNAVALPCVADWISVFSDRLDVFTLSSFAPVMAGLRSPMLTLAECLARSMSIAEQNTPHDAALGVFAIVLAGVDLVPANAFKPVGMGSEDWVPAVSAAARSVGINGEARIPGALGLVHSQVLSVLPAATGQALPKIGESAVAVVRILAALEGSPVHLPHAA